MAFTYNDFALLTVTLAGPILAVQVPKFIEHTRAAHDRREQLFKTLMATRAQRLAPRHIDALNMISIEFEKGKKFQPVREAWRAYLAHLSENLPEDPHQQAVFLSKRPELFVNLMFVMAKSLGHDLEKTQIEREVYITTYSTRVEAEWDAIRMGLAAILSGGVPFPMEVVKFPSDPDALAAQSEYLKAMAEKVRDGKPWPVEIIPAKVKPENEDKK
jgi:hypothetical protein